MTQITQMKKPVRALVFYLCHLRHLWTEVMHD